MAITVKNSTISETAWGSVDKSALGNKLANAYEQGDASKAVVSEAYAYAPPDAFGKDSDGNPTFSYSKCFGPHHELKGNTLVLNRGGVHACAVALSGGRSEPNLSSAAIASAKAHIRGHYKDLDEDVPDSLKSIEETAMRNKTMDRVQKAVQPEYKTFPMHFKAISDRSVTTLFSVSGNVDLVDDMVWPGAFQNTIAQRGTKVLHLWQHDAQQPPIAIVKSIQEIGRDQLPAEVLAQFPDAQGGTEAVSEFLTDARSDAIFQALKAGSPLEASFAYDAIRFDYQEKDGIEVRNLRELRLWEISTVNFGANGATLGDVGKMLLMPFELLMKQVDAHLLAIKAGARHSVDDVKMLNSIHDTAVQLGATNCMGLVDDEGGKGKGPDGEEEEDPEKEAEKSRAATRDAVALTLARRKLQLLELETVLSS